MTITVQPYSLNLWLHEPVTVRVTLKNTGDQPIHIHGSTSDTGAGFMTYDILDEQGNRIGYIPTSVADLAYIPNYQGVEIKPSESYIIWQDLTYQGNDEFTFNKPGRYTLRAHYLWDMRDPPLTKLDVASPWVAVYVSAPTGKEAKAHKAYLDLFNTRGVLAAAMEKRNLDFLTRYPNSRYRKFARVLYVGSLDYDASMAGGPVNKDKVIQELRAILADKPFCYTDNEKVELCMKLLEAGRRPEAHAMAERLLSGPALPHPLVDRLERATNGIPYREP